MSSIYSPARTAVRKSLFIYLSVTLFCAAASAIYEHFSHQVYSVYMVGLCLIPFVLGVIPNLLILHFSSLRKSNPWQKLIHAFAVATLTVGSALQGIIDIYGTMSPIIGYFFIAGGVLLLASFGLFVATSGRKHSNLKANLQN